MPRHLPVLQGREKVESRLSKTTRLPALEVMQRIQWTLAIPKRGGEPRLYASEPFFVADSKRPQMSTALFTTTTKMAAASFSLPAGPLNVGGTCPASMRKFDPEKDAICHSCYATKNSYIVYPSVQSGQVARMVWVRDQIAKGTFASSMIAGLHAWLAKPRFHATGIPQDPNYFRIHDSGDFGWLGAPYFEAWIEIARAFPHVKFWAPTRDWRSPFLKVRRPKNFVVRPSAYHFGDAPPEIAHLDAGTTASLKEGGWVVDGQQLKQWCGFRQPSTGICRCPAYETDESTCAAAGCRTCWEKPQQEVCYPRH